VVLVQDVENVKLESLVNRSSIELLETWFSC